MSAKFRTLGPFEVTRKNGELDLSSLRAIWANNKGLKDAVGVYIVATRKGDHLLPWYVGRSDRGFASRLNQHTIFEKISKKSAKGNLFMFLIARVTPKTGSLKRASRKFLVAGDETRSYSVKLKSINRLEFALIRTCLTQNKDLLNLQEKAFHEGLVVPGYLNDEQESLTDSAEELRKMLGTSR